jgi:hypothetical protein
MCIRAQQKSILKYQQKNIIKVSTKKYTPQLTGGYRISKTPLYKNKLPT